MRDFKNMKRQRGRNRGGNSGGGARPQQNANRAFESNGPDNVKIRGHAQHVFERYQQLARDAFSSGDRVLAENYLQHADHYFRLLRTIQPHRPASEILGRDTVASGLDIDFEEEFEAQPEGGYAPEGAAEAGDGQQGFEPRQDGARPDAPRQDGPRYDRQDRYDNNRNDGPRSDTGWRDRQDNRPDNRPDNRVGFDRPDRNERPYNDRQDRNRGYNDRAQEGERNDRFEGRRDNRRFDNNRRDDRNVPRETREPRFDPRPEGFAEGPQPSTPEPFEPAAAAAPVERAEPGPVLRSQDGLTSEAPAFLQPAAGDGEEARPRTRRRRAPRSFQPGEEGGEAGASPASDET